MSTTTIGLPLDIPWRRICHSTDMVHTDPCNQAPPDVWKSSIAIYRFDPDPQPEIPVPEGAEGLKIAYIRLDVTIAPWVPKLGNEGGILKTGIATPVDSKYAYKLDDFVSEQAIGSGFFEKSYPCYGALLQVSLDGHGELNGREKDLYFTDFEPKRRELYEGVTETGEMLSGSSSNLMVGKSGSSSQTTENFSKYGASFGIAAPITGGLFGGVSAETGNRSTNGLTQEQIEQTDKSVERRETQSHTTQLSQMYNLLQSFHVGSNRAVFLVDPRPHIISTVSTFINGPRAIEGIQQFFLVVAYPDVVGGDFCVKAHLDTAHLEYNNNQSTTKDADAVILYSNIVTVTGEKSRELPISLSEILKKSAKSLNLGEWEIDIEKTQQEMLTSFSNEYNHYKYEHPDWVIDREHAEVQSITETSIVIVAHNNALVDHNNVKYSLKVHLRKKNTISDDSSSDMKLFLTTRNLCCCEEGEGNPPCDGEDPSIIFEEDFTSVTGTNPFTPPLTTNVDYTKATMTKVRVMETEIRTEIIKSIESPRRYDPCSVSYMQSDTFLSKATGSLGNTDAAKELNVNIDETPILPPEIVDKMALKLGNMKLSQFLKKDVHVLAAVLKMSSYEVLDLKAQIVRRLRGSLDVAPVSPIRKITGLRIMSSYPYALNPRLVANITNPAELYSVEVTDQANVIEVDFSGMPDPGTLSTTSFFVAKGGAAETATLQMITPKRARLILSNALEPNGIYTINLLGTGGSAIKFGGVNLDGDPISIPSGDNVAGGNFMCVMRVGSSITAPTLPTIPPALIKVIGARIRNTTTNAILNEVIDPSSLQNVKYADTPNVIDVDFNLEPDPGTLTTSTFKITTDAGAVGATLSSLSSTTARLTITDPIVPGAVYTVTVVGTTGTCVKYSTRKLDGEPSRFPSGDNTEGGDFTFKFKIGAAPEPTPTPVVLAKVIGMRIRTSNPDPMNPVTLHEVVSVPAMHAVALVDLPDIVEFDLNVAADGGTVTTSSVTLTGPSGSVSGTVTGVSATKFRFKSTTALPAGTYTIKLSGTGTNSIQYSSRKLDGDGLTLPSGNGAEGGDFILTFVVVSI